MVGQTVKVKTESGAGYLYCTAIKYEEGLYLVELGDGSRMWVRQGRVEAV